MRTIRWFLGLAAIAALLGLNFLFAGIPLVYKFFNVLLFCTLLLLIRLAFGPTVADRIVAVDILGILVVGFCSLLSVATASSFYLDIAIAWALQSFIASLALAKIMEGRHLDA